jgi:hypothetical protein
MGRASSRVIVGTSAFKGGCIIGHFQPLSVDLLVRASQTSLDEEQSASFPPIVD